MGARWPWWDVKKGARTEVQRASGGESLKAEHAPQRDGFYPMLSVPQHSSIFHLATYFVFGV